MNDEPGASRAVVPESFHTDRLSAERLAQEHQGAVERFHVDPEVMRELGGERDARQTADYLERNLQHWAEHGFGVWMLRERERSDPVEESDPVEASEPVGRAVLRRLDVNGVEEVEVGYAFYPRLWGQGLATEVCAACLRIARMHLQLETVVGVTTRGHVKSQRVLTKLGFVHERDLTVEGYPCELFRVRFPALPR